MRKLPSYCEPLLPNPSETVLLVCFTFIQQRRALFLLLLVFLAYFLLSLTCIYFDLFKDNDINLKLIQFLGLRKSNKIYWMCQ